MTTQTITIRIEGEGADKVKSQFDEVEKSTKGIGDTLGKVGTIAGGFLAAGAVSAGVQKLTGFMSDSVAAIQESIQVNTQLDAVLKSTGGAVGKTADEIKSLAGELEKQTKFEDEAILQGQNLLLTFTNIGDAADGSSQIFTDTSKIMLDMAQAMGTDAKGSAIQLGKALNDPIKGISALSRVGVSFTDEQKEQIKVLQESGDMVGAQTIILNELNKEFGGSAKAASDAAGSQEKYKDQMNDLKETIGTQLLPIQQKWMELQAAVVSFIATRVIPIIESFVNYIKFVVSEGDTMNDFLSELPGPLQGVAKAFGDIVKAIVDNWPQIMQVVGFVVDYVQTRIEGMIKVISSIIEIVTSVVNLISALVHGDWSKAWKELGDIVDAAVQLVVGYIEMTFGNIPKVIIGIAKDAANAALDFGEGIVKSVADAIESLAETVLGFFEDAIKAYVGLYKDAFDAALKFGENIFNAVKEALSDFGQMIWDVISDAIKFYAGLYQTAFEAAFKIGEGIFNAVKDALVNFGQMVWDIIWNAIEFYASLFQTAFDAAYSIGKGIFDAVASALLTFGQMIWDIWWNAIQFYASLFQAAWDAAWSIGTGIFNAVAEALFSFGQMVWDRIWQGIQSIWDLGQSAFDAAWNMGTSIFNAVKDATAGIPKMLLDLGWEAIRELARGIGDGAQWLAGEVTRFIEGAIPGPIRSLLKIGSPSGLMMEFGWDIIRGLMNGIRDMLPSLAQGAAEAAGVIWNGLSGAASTISNVGDAIGGVIGRIIPGGGGGGGSIGGAERWRELVSMYFPANQVDNALRIINAESGGNEFAVSPPNYNGSRDVGLFQINDIHGLSQAARQNAVSNVSFAASLWRQSGWQPWSTAPKLGLYEMGTPFVPSNQLAFLHRGEAVIPANMNPFSGGGGGMGAMYISNVNLPSVTNAKQFVDELVRMQTQGLRLAKRGS